MMPLKDKGRAKYKITLLVVVQPISLKIPSKEAYVFFVKLSKKKLALCGTKINTGPYIYFQFSCSIYQKSQSFFKT